jgi:hypothetical protein
LAMTARSSAAVLHARTLRMRSRSFKDIVSIDYVFNIEMMEEVATLGDTPAMSMYNTDSGNTKTPKGRVSAQSIPEV